MHRRRIDGDLPALSIVQPSKTERSNYYRLRKPIRLRSTGPPAYVLHLAEPRALSDVKLQQLCFCASCRCSARAYKGFHLNLSVFAYGAFSKDLDNDLMSLARKEQVRKLFALRSGTG